VLKRSCAIERRPNNRCPAPRSHFCVPPSEPQGAGSPAKEAPGRAGSGAHLQRADAAEVQRGEEHGLLPDRHFHHEFVEAVDGSAAAGTADQSGAADCVVSGTDQSGAADCVVSGTQRGTADQSGAADCVVSGRGGERGGESIHLLVQGSEQRGGERGPKGVSRARRATGLHPATEWSMSSSRRLPRISARPAGRHSFDVNSV
jgi:hypothetical protein